MRPCDSVCGTRWTRWAPPSRPCSAAPGVSRVAARLRCGPRAGVGAVRAAAAPPRRAGAVALDPGRADLEPRGWDRGPHRVQRVPQTESQGRIHTSTATVAVMPEVE